MGEFNSVEEILEFAIGREIEAYQLYKYWAARTKDNPVSKVFEDFSKEELGHKERLELEVMKQGSVVHSSEDVTAMKIANYDTEGEKSLNIDYRDVLVLAINKERISFRLYVDLAMVVKDKESREASLAIAEEEARHKTRFELEYEEIMSEGK